MSNREIEAFLACPRFAVVGASTDRAKYGNKVLRCYLQNGRAAVPVNPRAETIEGVACVPDLRSLEGADWGVSIITPPRITERLVEDAIAVGLTHLWMQPGAESADAVTRASASGLTVIHGGPCVLVVLGFRDE